MKDLKKYSTLGSFLRKLRIDAAQGINGETEDQHLMPEDKGKVMQESDTQPGFPVKNLRMKSSQPGNKSK